MEADSSTCNRPAKKSGRSTSPRAVELRRYQNRMSQRNHRRRVREAVQGSNTNETHPNDSENSSTAGSTVSHSSTPCSNFGSSFPDLMLSPISTNSAMMLGHGYSTADPLGFQEEPAWAPYLNNYMTDLMSSGNSYQASSLQNCLCSSATGPCPGHLEQIRLQVLSKSGASLLQQDQQKPHPWSSHQQQDHSLPPLGSKDVNSSCGKQNNVFASPFSRSDRPRTASEASSLRSSVYENPLPVSSTTPETLRLETSNSDTTADMTRRFDALLGSMRTFGLPDFDTTAATYYTANFDANSRPAMAQIASRSRRLKDMVTMLQSHSDHWPRHQSRGLHESLLTATTLICTKEIEAFAERNEYSAHNKDCGAFIEAFEQLLREHGLLLENYGRPPRGAAESRPSWDETENGPESMPYLWSLLTGLSGLKGLYCDRVARLVLAILLFAQRMQ